MFGLSCETKGNSLSDHTPSPPRKLFPKIHPFWYHHLSQYLDDGLVEYKVNKVPESAISKVPESAISRLWNLVTCKKRVMLRRRLFWPKKIAEKVRKSRQNVNRDKSA